MADEGAQRGSRQGLGGTRRRHHIWHMDATDKPAPTPERDAAPAPAEKPPENGGPKGPEPTRYGDWEQNGRCTDF
jgi:hypothetical protein